MAPRRNMPKSDPTPLRKSRAYAEPDEDQEQALGAFITAALISHVAVYATRYTSSGAIKLRLYAEGETYEDVLETNEPWDTLFHDYAKQLGFLAHYQGIMGIYNARRAERAAEGPPSNPLAPDSPPPPSKSLRARP